MTVTDYRAFGECPKAYLTDGDSADIVAKIVAGAAISLQFSSMHVNVLEASELIVTQTYDLTNASELNVSAAAGTQITGLSYIAVTTGKVQILFLS